MNKHPPPASPSSSPSPSPSPTPTQHQSFTSALRSPESPLWLEIDAICAKHFSPSSPLSPLPTSSSSSYSTHLNTALQSLHPLFLPSGPLDQAIAVLDETTLHLSTIEFNLDHTIATLHSNATALDDAASLHTHLGDQLRALTQIHHHVAAFTDHIHLPSQMAATLRVAHPHSEEFGRALGELRSKLAFVRVEVAAGSVVCSEVLDELEPLRAQVVDRVMHRLEESLRLLKVPSSTFEIMRDTLLGKRRYLLDFIADLAEDGSIDHVLRQYVHIASRVAESAISAYCDALATWAAIERAPGSSFDLTSIARGTTSIFSAIFTETLFGPGEVADLAERTGIQKGREEGDGAAGALGRVGSRRERVEAVLRRWTEALRAARQPGLTLADILMRQRNSHPTVEEVCRNATLFYLDFLERERRFLTGTFGEGSATFLKNVFRDCEHSPLVLIQAKVGQALEHHDDLTGILICLLLNRVHRSKIVEEETHDIRITFLVHVEKVLQTRLLAEFDDSVEKLGALPAASLKAGLGEVYYSKLVAMLTDLVTGMLLVIIRATKDVSAEDIFDTIQRRLLSFVKQLVKTIELVGHSFADQSSRLRSHLRRTAVVLTVLEVPVDYVIDGDVAGQLKEPVKALFSHACEEYGACVVRKSMGELFKAQEAVEAHQYDEAKVELTRFRDKLNFKIQSMADSYSFLRDESNISRSYRRAAIEAALKDLVEKNDHVARLVQERMPADSHFVVTKGELVLVANKYR